MRLRAALPAALCAAVLAGCAGRAAPPERGGSAHEVHWSYTSATGPAAWSSLDPAFRQCATGTRQSPIQLATVTAQTAGADIRVSYGPARATVANNGHTIQATFERGGTLRSQNKDYQLLQLHHHRPSEHTVDGRPAALEVHLVHRAADDDLAVIGALFDVGGVADSVVAALIRHGSGQAPSPPVTIDPSTLIPRELAYFSYDGSLTTPPCSETVRWIVLHERRSISPDQLVQLQRMLSPNARPVMPVGDRRVLFSRPTR